MIQYSIKKELFTFKYLPEYASYLLEGRLEEFTTVSIRFCRQYELPMMRPLAKLPEKELTALSVESSRELLTALAGNRVAELIEKNTNKWIENKIGIIDQSEVTAEDLTLAYFIRRKTFGYFLYSYSPNPAIHQLITEEVDMYTTQEELINLRVYLQMHSLH